MAQELLSTFEDELEAVTLKPGHGGVLDVRLNGETVWSRNQKGRFPDVKELKRCIRDRVVPGRSLGHTDRIDE
jgi:selenoprotein W-related protein